MSARVWWVCVILACAMPTGARAELGDLNLDAKPGAGADDAIDEITGSGFRSLRGDARAKAIQAMLARPQPKDVPDLCAIVTQELDGAGVEQQAFSAALRLGGPGVVPAGKSLLAHATAVRQGMGVQLLAASGSPAEAVPALMEAVREPGRGANADLRFEFIRAFLRLKAAAAMPVVKAWAGDGSQPENAQWARLWLATMGETGPFEKVLADQEDVQKVWRQLVHDIDVMAPYWPPQMMRDARKQAGRYQMYADAFDGLLAMIGEPQMKALVRFLQARDDAYLPDLLYTALDHVQTEGNRAVYLLALDAPYPVLTDEIAHRLIEAGDAGLAAKVCDVLRRKQTGESYIDRAQAVRLVDLFPAEERESVLRKALGDASAYVVEEGVQAVRRLRPANTAALVAAVAADPRWQANGRLQWLVRRCTAPGQDTASP